MCVSVCVCVCVSLHACGQWGVGVSKHAFLVSQPSVLVLRNAKEHIPPDPSLVTMSLHCFLITLSTVAIENYFFRTVNPRRPREHTPSSMKDGGSVTKGPGHGHGGGRHLLPPSRSRLCSVVVHALRALPGGSAESAQWVTRRLLCGRKSNTQSDKRYLQLLSLFSWKLTKKMT